MRIEGERERQRGKTEKEKAVKTLVHKTIAIGKSNICPLVITRTPGKLPGCTPSPESLGRIFSSSGRVDLVYSAFQLIR